MTDNADQSRQSLITFPCDFTIKVFGLAAPEFEAAVFSIISKHVPTFADRAIQARPSEHGKYCALTITLHIDSKEQLDQIYRDLSSSPQIIMVL